MNESGNEAGSVTVELPKGLTLGSLIDAYQTDKVSTFHKLRYHVRENQRSLLKRILARYGEVDLGTVKKRHILEWHMEWSEDGKLSSGHSFIALIRTMCGFGADILEDENCLRICMILHRTKFAHADPRIVWLTSDQANQIREVACAHFGWPSIAFAQAIQFELLLRQKDVIGEWVPEIEPGESYVRHGGEKWLRGICWEEIDDKMVLRHKTSKRQKVLEIDLSLSPMMVEEFGMIDAVRDGEVKRELLPARGPMLICDITGLPWKATEFRRKWRLVADKAGVPKNVRNMDSRAGGITEASHAGADVEHVKHAATHSDIAQTQRYSRGAAEKIANVQQKRAAFRKKFRHNS